MWLLSVLLSVLLPLLKLYFCGVKVLLYQTFNRSFTLPVLSRQDGRVAMVTGGTRGMGYETAKQLAKLGMHVVIAGNNREEGAAAVRRIQEEDSQGNAGTMMVPEGRTEDGFEIHLGLNYLGHFLLTNLLLDTLKRWGRPGRCARIINMSSATHYAGEMHMDDLNRRRCYSSHGAYAQSKLALVLFTYHLQEQLTAGGFPVSVSAVDPGMVDTALYDNLWSITQALKKPVAKLLFRTPAEGASTSVYAAAASEMEGVGGCYLYNGHRKQSSDTSYDCELQAELWKKSCELVGLQTARLLL
ncbi:dehydrogenase/reductase SDR family member on chromosome X isoform X3 [Etheostoma cragini]|uniref:dehydrogenase/reductase SDR family member on chromosome X isoform X3 n=1 Tax=Etheostoma cragini TaxID=417921 RepID=UPI00155F48B6|nr:dehydrogenase/reductase SDR family member on chromosome X isoform X3 [Etheostoma cragini]